MINNELDRLDEDVESVEDWLLSRFLAPVRYLSHNTSIFEEFAVILNIRERLGEIAVITEVTNKINFKYPRKQ